MTLALVDRDGRSAIAAAEGHAALAAGDTPRAREKFKEAGDALEKSIPGLRRQGQKHLVRFLAATQYFNGGHYAEAFKLCRKIEQRLLPPETRGLFPHFFRDVRERAGDAYARGVRRQLIGLWPEKDFTAILETLQHHPYVLSPGNMAFIRAVICEKLKNYRAAALFYATALRHSPNDPDLVYCAAALPLTLSGEGRLDEAWDYARHQLELLPHPVIHLVASLLCFHRATAEQEEGRYRPLFEEQFRHFAQARATCQELPANQQAKKELRELMILGFEAAALGWIRLDDRRAARAACDEAISFAPESPRVWTVRGIVKDPEGEAADDFKKAVSLGDDSYFPYFYLAQDALGRDDFGPALSWAQQALQKPKKPHPHVAAQLYAWMAIGREKSGADPKEVESLLRRAVEIDPTNEVIRSDFQLFLNAQGSSLARAPFSLRRNDPRAMAEIFVRDQVSYLTDGFARTDALRRVPELLAA